MDWSSTDRRMAGILAAGQGAASLPWMRHLTVTLLLLSIACTARAETPDQQANRRLTSMTQAEKIALLHGAFAAFPDRPKPAGAIGSAGFVPGIKRLGIPDLQETDAGLGITNPNTIRPGDTAVALPSGLATAASFDPDAAYANGGVLGREAAARGFNVVLGGGANLVRDPRGGRQFEYAGEDPLLAGTMVGAAVRGIQDQHVIATVKHFVGNDQETGRTVLSVALDEAALRESDLLAFEIAIEQGHPGAVMCAYNRVGGVYACENRDLLTDALKQDWHFPGWVMSDWGAVHGVDAINAGLDQESGEQFDPAVYFAAPLEKAVASGAVTQARVDDAVRRILHSMDAAGLFQARTARDDVAEDVRAARRVATEGVVLLRNQDGLPLPKTLRRVCVIGGQADAGVPAGGGSSQVTPLGGVARRVSHDVAVQPPDFAVQVFDPPSPLARIKAKLPGAEVVFDDGSAPARAAALARGCDAALVFATDFSGEEIDRAGLGLPGGQDRLIASVAAANPRTVVVLETAGAVTMPWLAQTGAVLEAWYGGSGGADAVTDILFGDAAPSGRLPVTFPKSVQDLPNPVLPGAGLPPGKGFVVHYPEGADVGYRWFARRHAAPLFPFGFGLSMTHFSYENLRVSGGGGLKVSFDVRDDGARDGVAVPQLYLTSRNGAPVRRLLGWRRQVLRRGETRHVEIGVDMRLVADFDAKARRWVVPRGKYSVAVGENAEDAQLRGEADVAALSFAP